MSETKAPIKRAEVRWPGLDTVYTINADECATLMADPAWTFENYAFRADLPAAEDCPADRVRVVRVFNNFKGGALNHRFTTSASEAASLAGEGWIIEGAVFCTPP